mgnify:CR=1 FL=1
MKNLFAIVAISALSLLSHPVLAASKQETKMLKSAAECTYVLQIAEENGVKLNNSRPAINWAWMQGPIIMKPKQNMNPAPERWVMTILSQR